MVLADQAQGSHGLFTIGKGIARTGNTCHAYPWFLGQDFLHIDTGLLGTEQGAGHPWSGFIDAVIFAITEIAFDIALWRNRQVDSAEFALGLRVETGVAMVVFDLGFFHGNILLETQQILMNITDRPEACLGEAGSTYARLSHIAVTDIRIVLLFGDYGIGNGIEQGLGTVITDMENALAAHPIMDRKTDPH
jgi:hypothetical protein